MDSSANTSRDLTTKNLSAFILMLVASLLAGPAVSATRDAVTGNSVSGNSITMSGWISDAKCGAKMAGYCAKACITSGEKPVFITTAKEVLAIANAEATKGYEGERVTVQGSVEDSRLTIHSITLDPPKK
jgi:hypothetical protein